MKKTAINMILCAIVFNFTSCDKTRSIDESLPGGTWVVRSQDITKTQTIAGVTYKSHSAIIGEVYRFESDGTGTSDHVFDQYAFKWKATASAILFSDENGSWTVKVTLHEKENEKWVLDYTRKYYDQITGYTNSTKVSGTVSISKY